MANSVDPDQTPRSREYDLGLHCLLRPVCPNTYGKYGIYFRITTCRFKLWAVSENDPFVRCKQRLHRLARAFRCTHNNKGHFLALNIIIGPRYAKTCLRECADSECPYQPAHARSLIRACAVR